ncbi:Fic family protein [archaeon]|jgi:fido (protein-threonine AMPylation protein)|nr:Fic family protein [archaeon]MBT7128199.1 Fic family protein [archaeon]
MSGDLVRNFLRESNAIESEYGDVAFEDSVEAWNYALDRYNDFGIDYVCGIHERLMKRLNVGIAGKLRRKKIYIVGRNRDGRQVIIREIEAKGNKPRLRKWCERYNDIRDLIEIKEAHIDFEMIHPFADGNGRVGRILYNVQRVNVGEDVRVFWEREKGNYYEWFVDRRKRNMWIELYMGLDKEKNN